MSRPNLLVIHTDQQSLWTVSAYGEESLVSTPNIDRLAREGALCTQFFTNSAVCTPSRGCLLTGRYPHDHGAYTNNVPLNADEVTFAEVCRRAGYETAYAGKWHLDGHRRPGWVHPARGMGFTDTTTMFNRGHWKQILEQPGIEDPTVFPYGVIGDETSFTTDWLKDKTLDFLRRERQGPFCFMVSIPDPHTPFTVRAPYDTLFAPEDMPVPESFSNADLPSWAAAAQARGPYALDNPEREAVLRRNKAQYCGQVKLIDDCVGALLEELEAQGTLDDTVVVFTTDHGEYMGEHGLLGKNHMYEGAYRIPLVIRYPRRIAAGTRVDVLWSTVDFQPTLLRLMGLAPCGREGGRDASALLTGASVPWEDEVQLHHCSHRLAGVVTPEWSLALAENGEARLFDRQADPHQLRDLSTSAAHEGLRRELTACVARHHAAVASPSAAWLSEGGGVSPGSRH